MALIDRLIIGAALVALGFGVHAQMYKWTDENGQVHFSDKPHANAKEMNIKTPRSSGIGSTRQQKRSQQETLKDLEYSRQQRAKKAKDAQKQRDQLERQCTQLRNELRNYQDVDYLFIRDENGKKKRLTSARKKQEEQRLRTQIAERCE